jgi:hypothetical protein
MVTVECKSYYYDNNGDMIVETVDGKTFKLTNAKVVGYESNATYSDGSKVECKTVEMVGRVYNPEED